MSQSDPYFQFPIGLMLEGGDTCAICQRIVDYAVWNYALSLTDIPESERESQAFEYIDEFQLFESDFDPDDNDHIDICAAARRLDVELPYIPRAVEAGQELKDRYGSFGTQCRIRNDILWSAQAEEKPWPELKFRVLCAVYAGIGNRRLTCLNHRMIQALAAGHDSPRGLSNDALVPRSSVRYWLEELWYDNFFQFCKQGFRRWYSHSMPDDQSLANAVRALPQNLPGGERRSKKPVQVVGDRPQ